MPVTKKNAPANGVAAPGEGEDRNPTKGTIVNEATSVPNSADIERGLFRAHGERYAALVWNHANDLEFVDQVLADMVDDDGQVSERHLRHVFRFALMRLADELRLTFPTRPEFPEVTK